MDFLDDLCSPTAGSNNASSDTSSNSAPSASLGTLVPLEPSGAGAVLAAAVAKAVRSKSKCVGWGHWSSLTEEQKQLRG